MSLRTHVVFEADISDEGVWKPSGAAILAPGINIASTLVEILTQDGFEVSGLDQLESFGWMFTVSGTIWFVIQFPGPWLLLSRNKGPLMQKLFNRKKSTQIHRDILERLNELLKQDGRFHAIRWFTEEEYEKDKNNSDPGHSEP